VQRPKPLYHLRITFDLIQNLVLSLGSTSNIIHLPSTYLQTLHIASNLLRSCFLLLGRARNPVLHLGRISRLPLGVFWCWVSSRHPFPFVHHSEGQPHINSVSKLWPSPTSNTHLDPHAITYSCSMKLGSWTPWQRTFWSCYLHHHWYKCWFYILYLLQASIINF